MIDPTAEFPTDTMWPSAPRVPDIQLIRRIGEGGFGQVWLGRNRITGHLRAVKVIPLQGSAARDRAGREVTSISRLESNLCRQHPNLVTIHHVGRTDRCVFYVMDPADDIRGGPATISSSYRPATLARRLADGPVPTCDCLRYAHQLLAGLASLHQAGMVHRDVKPANCLLIDDQLKLADFGLLTHAGPQISRVGTEIYMPPDGRMDARADVYAAGLVIYEMLTGMPPDRFPQLGNRAAQMAANSDLCQLVRLLLTACQPDPQCRPSDAGVMAAKLANAGEHVHGVKRVSRRRWYGMAGAVVLAMGLGGLGYWLCLPPRVHVNFTTYPFEATVVIDGRLQWTPQGKPYATPCTIDNLPARVHQVRFQLPGRPDLDAGQIDFGQVRQVVAHWGES